MVELWDLSITVVGAFLSMMMFSTLYGKGNPLYSFAEESYIGFAMGLTITQNLLNLYRLGYQNIAAGDYILSIGIVVGLLMLLRVSKQYAYLARLGIAVVLGTQFGLSMRTVIFSNFIQQINASLVPLFGTNQTTNLYNWVTTLCLFFMLTFFLYTTEIKGPLEWSNKLGEYALYTSFGAIFAQTFMSRLGLFVGFMQGYTDMDYKKPILIAAMVIVLAAVVALDKTGIGAKLTPEE